MVLRDLSEEASHVERWVWWLAPLLDPSVPFLGACVGCVAGGIVGAIAGDKNPGGAVASAVSGASSCPGKK